MSPVKLLSIILVSALLFPACEGFRSAHGIVKDKATGLPIDSVLCDVLTAGNYKILTDSVGRFSVQNAMGGCMPHCKDITVRFSKTGYQVLEVTNPVDTIFYLQKQ